MDRPQAFADEFILSWRKKHPKPAPDKGFDDSFKKVSGETPTKAGEEPIRGDGFTMVHSWSSADNTPRYGLNGIRTDL